MKEGYSMSDCKANLKKDGNNAQVNGKERGKDGKEKW